ncbi:excalibur calcium-binding domain-containing protein [Streptomyces sp. NPDC057543]|uniref:excalibur calcium-binding domain-containing protein n=1 Tax=Streptomyces sp. NPDC057543 TaxID=3346163 RepID=UPI003683917F
MDDHVDRARCPSTTTSQAWGSVVRKIPQGRRTRPTQKPRRGRHSGTGRHRDGVREPGAGGDRHEDQDHHGDRHAGGQGQGQGRGRGRRYIRWIRFGWWRQQLGVLRQVHRRPRSRRRPIHTGEPGYGRRLDRDGDGIGCEQTPVDALFTAMADRRPGAGP